MFSCCGARHLPASAGLLGICRPLPLARLLPPATGGSRLAPHRRPRHCVRHRGECGVWGCVLGDGDALNQHPFSPLSGGTAAILFEYVGKIVWGFKPASKGNFFDRHFLLLEELLCFFDAQMIQIGDGRDMHIFFETPYPPLLYLPT